jgi:hypothetical protein
MRLAALTAVALAFACTRPAPEASSAPARDDLSLESLKLPAQTGTSQISGTVARREGGTVLLDSGGPTPIPLRIGNGAQVTVDDQPGTGAQIGEGDLVRAAYRLDGSGEAQALQVVANTKPVQTEKVTARQQPSAPQPAASPSR